MAIFLSQLMGNKFRYYLTYQSNEVELVFAPKGWEEQTLAGYKRDLTKYFGLIRSLSLPLTFVKDGYNICRYAFLNDGYEAGVRLRVDIRERRWNYKTIFVGDLDFSKYVPDGQQCEIPLMESGYSRDIKAKENTIYEHILEGDDVVNIILPGIKFKENSDWITKYVDVNSLNVGKKFVIGVDLVNQGFQSGFVASLNTEFRNATDTDNFTGDAFVRGNRLGGQAVRVQGTLTGYTFRQSGTPGTLVELIFLNTVTKGRINVPYSTVTNSNVSPFTVTFDFNYTLQYGEGLCLYSRADRITSGSYVTVTEGEISVSYASVSDPSNCKAIRGFDLLKRALAKINPSIQFNSVLINRDWKDLLFTSGTAIRELENPKIKISFSDLFQTFNSITDVGLGEDMGVYRLEEGYYFARNSQIVDIGKVSQGGYQMSIAEELVGNVVKIGYNDGNTENQDGLQEYNSGQVYDLPTTRIQKEINWVSPVRADQYGIEKLRVDYNITRQSTSDTSSDNDTFMVDCYLDGSDFRPILGDTYTSVTGLFFPESAYNLRLTPKQNLLRHSAFLASILDRMNGRYIEFASGEKNTDLVTVKGGVSVAESSSVAVNSLQGKYFQPYIFTITAKFPKYVIDLMDLTPFGYVAFEYGGIKAKGYLVAPNVDLAENSEQEIKLLATWDSLIP